MPIPENPQSRSEQYLNAIATGDNSCLPEFPQSRMEQYLDYIAQNGGGGGGGGGALIVHATDNEAGTAAVLDKTWQEIKDASATSVVVLSIGIGDEFAYLSSCIHAALGGEWWRVGFFGNQVEFVFQTTEGANAHPEMQYE